MKLVDANVLLYAVNRDSDRHDPSRRWLDGALSGGDSVGFAWIALLAFVRLVTKPEIFPRPLAVAAAIDQVDAWTHAPAVRIVHPGTGHAATLDRLLASTGSGGNLVNDAHLAALALEHRARIVSYDRDFARFDGVRWQRPDDLLG